MSKSTQSPGDEKKGAGAVQVRGGSPDGMYSSTQKLSSERYKAFVEDIEEGVYEIDIDGYFLYFNDALCEIFGYPRTEIQFRNIRKFMDPQSAADAFSRFDSIYRTGRGITDFVWKTVGKNEETRVISLSAHLIKNQEGKGVGFRGIARDITHKTRIARNNESLLNFSLELPEHHELEELLDFVTTEVKRMLEVEGALVIFLDEEKHELFFKAAAHEDTTAQKRAKELRWPADTGVSGRVIRTGEPAVVDDVSSDEDFYPVVDLKAGFTTKSLLDVPLRSRDRIIGVLSAMNKKSGPFDEIDVELLNTMAGSVALSIENVKFAEELKKAYKEVSSLNRAKDKVINHLSHELKTPLSVLGACLSIIEKRISSIPKNLWEPVLDRARRNLDRILEVQYEVEDIMRNGHYRTNYMLSTMLEVCRDQLASLVEIESGKGDLAERVSARIDDIFGPKDYVSEPIRLDQFIPPFLDDLKDSFVHRKINIVTDFQEVEPVMIPGAVLGKVVGGLIKNAVENTPDGGKVEVAVRPEGSGVELVVTDYGVGITEENQRRIFEGFFTTQETMDYSSKKPFDFNAGGRGADLLRMKIFSERFGFRINMTSKRCKYIPGASDKCPGDIDRCPHCASVVDCLKSGGTVFTVFFRPAGENKVQQIEMEQSTEVD
jgi:PAS domain S-box-containing protein